MRIILPRAAKSYGIEVARLAGLPRSVIEPAKSFAGTSRASTS